MEAMLPAAEFHAIKLQSRWAAWRPKTRVGNALALPYPDGHFDGICTSPTYGNRMADNVQAATPTGVSVRNITEHFRRGRRPRVTLWHLLCLANLGF